MNEIDVGTRVKTAITVVLEAEEEMAMDNREETQASATARISSMRMVSPNDGAPKISDSSNQIMIMTLRTTNTKEKRQSGRTFTSSSTHFDSIHSKDVRLPSDRTCIPAYGASLNDGIGRNLKIPPDLRSGSPQKESDYGQST